MFAYFQVAHPLNRDRVAEDVGPIDKWRYLLWVRAVKRGESNGKVDLHKLAFAAQGSGNDRHIRLPSPPRRGPICAGIA